MSFKPNGVLALGSLGPMTTCCATQSLFFVFGVLATETVSLSPTCATVGVAEIEGPWSCRPTVSAARGTGEPAVGGPAMFSAGSAPAQNSPARGRLRVDHSRHAATQAPARRPTAIAAW